MGASAALAGRFSIWERGEDQGFMVQAYNAASTAVLAVLRGQLERAARLLGAAEAAR